jgi:hypothetical protein
VALVWGAQVDVRPITLGVGRDDRTGDVHPELVAAYLAKYLTKSTEDFGLDGHGRVHSATDARYLGASAHAVRIIETAEQLAATGGEDYGRLADRYGTLGYRGHVLPRPAATRRPSGRCARPAATGTEPVTGPPTTARRVSSTAATTEPVTRPTSWSSARGATWVPATSTPTAPPWP